MSSSLSEDWLEAVRSSCPRECDSCGRDILPGQRFNVNRHTTDMVVECDSCHRQRYSWFYSARKPRVHFIAMLVALLAAIFVAGGAVLLRFLLL